MNEAPAINGIRDSYPFHWTLHGWRNTLSASEEWPLGHFPASVADRSHFRAYLYIPSTTMGALIELFCRSAESQ